MMTHGNVVAPAAAVMTKGYIRALAQLLLFSNREVVYLIPRLRDLAFSVDIRFSSLEENSGGLSEGLWRRAKSAGAFTPMEKRAFGIANDIFVYRILARKRKVQKRVHLMPKSV